MYSYAPEGRWNIHRTDKGYAAMADKCMQLVQIEQALEHSPSMSDGPSGRLGITGKATI
jgi:hypothetical protein